MAPVEGEDVDGSGQTYDEASFWAKIGRFATAAGRNVVEAALTLRYCLADRDTPAWARAAIVGALGYFVLPLDAIPDPTPLAGFTDDLGALAAAFATVAAYVKPEHRARARAQLHLWFG